MQQHLSGRDDRGAVLVLLGLSLTVLMIFAAFAIDLGAARSARRKAQGTVDGGVFAGGLLLIDENGQRVFPTESAIANAVIEVTHQNLTADPTLTDAGGITEDEWRNRFVACRDTDPHPRFPVRSTVSECISFNTQMTRVRVRLPELNLPTYFAGVIGIHQLHTRADAEVELVTTNTGGVVPFGIPGGSGSIEACLKDTGGPTPPFSPCNGPDRGNFGTLNFRLFGNPLLGTPSVCSDSEPELLETNIAVGVDHELSTYSSDPPTHDGNVCPDLSARPNQTDGRPGFIAQTVDNGLIVGTSAFGPTFPGRLTNGPWATRAVRDRAPLLDDRPLWEFLDRSLTDATAPAACVYGATTTPKASMLGCLQAYLDPANTLRPQLFGADVAPADGVADILQSPRLAWVPEFVEPDWGTGRSDYRFAAFRPVFLQTLYFKCTNGGCAGVFDPQETGTGLPLRDTNANKVEALTALLLTDEMLPQAVLDRGPNGTTRFYEVVLRT